MPRSPSARSSHGSGRTVTATDGNDQRRKRSRMSCAVNGRAFGALGKDSTVLPELSRRRANVLEDAVLAENADELGYTIFGEI